MHKKLLFSLVFLSGFAFSFALSVSVSPARYELHADKGKTVYGDFTVTNESDSDQVYVTSVENFKSQGESGVPLFVKENKDVASWIKVDDTVTLAKGEKKTISYSITIPEDTDAGGHYGSIFLYAKPPEGKEVSVSIGTKVGILVLLTVNGDIKIGGDIKDFSAINPRDRDVKKGFYFTDLPITYSYRFTNSGNDRINPYGVITVTNTFGFVSDILSANPTQGNVLQQSTRKFDITWGEGSKESVPDDYFSRAFYQARHFAFGIYKAHLKIAYDVAPKKDIIESSQDMARNIEASSMTAEKSIHVFMFPWQLLSLSAVLLFVFFIIFTRGLKRYNKWVIKQAKLSMH
jgi:hypothetical protein